MKKKMQISKKRLVAIVLLVSLLATTLAYALITWQRNIPTEYIISTDWEWQFQYCDDYPEFDVWVGNGTEIMVWSGLNGTQVHRGDTFVLQGYLEYVGDAVDLSAVRPYWNYTGNVGTGSVLYANISCNEDPSVWDSWSQDSPWGDANYHMKVKFTLEIGSATPDNTYSFTLNVYSNHV